MKQKPLPITLLSGFLGAGKTTLLNHLLHQQQNLRLAVVVNDMSEINIDGGQIRRLLGAPAGALPVVEMSNGCICCTLREDLLVELIQLAISQQFDYILIESSGIAEPMGVAEAFTFEIDETGRTLADLAQLDTLVTVVDAFNFWRLYQAGQPLQEEGLAVDKTDERTITDLLVDQIEFANVIVINKVDQVSEAELNQLQAILHQLNPQARCICTSFGQVNSADLLQTGAFRLEQAEAISGWLTEPRYSPTPETAEYGVSNYPFTANRPFHPGRLLQFIEEQLPQVVRSKGLFWLATRPDQAGWWSQAGPLLNLECVGEWDNTQVTALDETLWGSGWESLGRPRQELVFIGINLDHNRLAQTLNEALLTPAEMAVGAAGWQTWADPLPTWDITPEPF